MNLDADSVASRLLAMVSPRQRVESTPRPTNEVVTTSGDLAKILTHLYGGECAAGMSVNADSAMRCAAVYACVRVLAESVAQLPAHLFRRQPNGGKVRDNEHTLYRLLNVQPNVWQTAFEFREMLMGHLCLRGNAFAYKNKNMDDGKLVELIPLHPDKMTVKQGHDYSLSYTYERLDSPPLPLRQDEVWHLRGLSSDGVHGLNPIALARESIGLGMACERHGSRLFKQGAQPGGMLKHPHALKPERIKMLQEDFDAKYGGPDNAGKTIVLEDGMDFVRIGMTSEDAQFLETRKYQRSEIASIFRVPPHMIGDLERATFSNIEHQGLEFVTHTMLPWLRRIEQAAMRDLITVDEKPKVFVEFNVDGLLRGDIRSRYGAYDIGVRGGWINRNEVREKENMDRVDGLDEFLVPLNMATSTERQEPEPEPSGSRNGNADGNGNGRQYAGRNLALVV